MLGLGGPEICGATAPGSGSWVSSFLWIGIGLGIVALLAGLRSRRTMR